MKEESFKIINGNKKILLSAPHSVLHQRQNNIRESETRTGDIVKRVAKEKRIIYTGVLSSYNCI